MCAPRHRPTSSRVALVALYAARDLVPGEELFVHYGEDMGRNYEVGEPAPDLLKYEIPAHASLRHASVGIADSQIQLD